MNKDRYELCKRFIEEGRWDVNLEEGTARGTYGSMGSHDTHGYLTLRVSENGKSYMFGVHEIIAIVGGLVPIDITIDHINGDKLDNRFCNLQLLSNEDNVSKAHIGKQLSDKTKKKIGDTQQGSKNNIAELTEEQVAEIKMMLLDGKLSQSCIAWLYNVSSQAITDIKKGKTWNHVKVEDYI